MKSKLIFIILLFCSCTNNKFNGYVYDYDTERPIKNVHIDINGNKTQTDSAGYFCVEVNLDSNLKISLNKRGFAAKMITRIPDSLGKFSKRSLHYNRIYLLNEESDFSK